MQNKNDELPKRTRYYSGMVDLNLLESGGSYKDLKNCYIMFICTFDPFGKDLCCYEFENYCVKDEIFPLEDGRKILLFNTSGTKINVPQKVKEFLDYIETKKSTNEFTDKVDKAVNKARQNKEWRLEYMKTLLHDMDVREEERQNSINTFIKATKKMGISKKAIKEALMSDYGLDPNTADEYLNKFEDE